jgi:two-component system response regulator CpxR
MAASSAHVLVIDDDQNGRDSLCELLQLRDFAATGARHGQEALDLLHDGLAPSLILLDLDMPIMTGGELLAALSAHDHLASIPVLIISAAPPAADVTGYVGFLQKPIAWQELLAAIERVLGSDR